MTGINVLFVYPNRETVLRIPLAVSVLSAVLKKAGHNPILFDSTFTGNKFETDIQYSEKKGTVKKSGIENYIGELDTRPVEDIVKQTINKHSPDLIAVTLLERNYSNAVEIIREIKRYSNAPILVGGILPTISPETVISVEEVDMICVGEGEGTIVDVANAIASGNPVDNIANLWVKADNRVIKNPLRPLINLDELPDQNWEIFDERHLFRAYKGEVYRNGSFEFARGCTKICSFCVAPKLRSVQNNLGPYHRFKTPEKVINEIIRKTDAYNLNLIHFGDTDFLFGMKENVLEKFTELYKKHIGLPFLIQTGAEAINERKMQLLKEAGCDNISVGVESGSDRIRKQIINKFVSKERIIKSFELGRKYKIRMTANYMLGLPDETEEDIMESIRFNRLLNPPAISVFFFTPFLGTELYDISLEKEYIKGFNPKTNVHKESPLEMYHLPKTRIDELMEEFVADFNTYKDEY